MVDRENSNPCSAIVDFSTLPRVLIFQIQKKGRWDGVQMQEEEEVEKERDENGGR